MTSMRDATPPPPRPVRVGPLAGLALALVGGLALAAGPEAAGESEEASGDVVHIRVDSIIHPISTQFILESLEEADRLGAAALVLELSTPGGLLDSTQKIVTGMLGARTPVVVYVAPSGAQAASAGFFILMASDVAAMAPGTRTGSATPVTPQAGEAAEDSPIERKMAEDAAAALRSLAERKGRNVELAELAVTESRSYTEREALEQGLVEILAPSLGRLLQEIDGWELEKPGEQRVVLRTAEAAVRELEMTAFQRFLSAIAHPNIAYLLLTLGGLGLYFELANPGAILPGVFGAICLILAFFALSVLPVNYAGVALILLAILFFLAEIWMPSYGMLTIGGIVSLILGSIMLIRTPEPALQISYELIVAFVLFMIVLVAFLTRMAIKAHRGRVHTGSEGLVSDRARARTDLKPHGKVFLQGELWDAESEEPVEAGAWVEVVAVEGMLLKVRPIGNPGHDEDKQGGS